MILEKLLEVRADLENADRIRAIETLMKRLYYDVAPCVSSGDTFNLFTYENTVEDFCKKNKIDIRAMNWLLEAMEKEKLISLGKMTVTLMPLGVEKLCVNK